MHRLPVLFVHILYGLLLVISSRLRLGGTWYDTEQGRAAIKQWATRACRILAIRIEVNGVISPVPGSLFVANHISWIDVLALYCILDTKFISKRAVKSWPLIGTLANSTGNIFIDRKRNFSLNAVISGLRAELESKHSITVFPEGTTTDGRAVNRFHSGLFNAVTNSDYVVQGIAICYTRNAERDELAPYVGDDNFILHLFRIASLSKTCLQIDFAIPFLPDSMSRHEIAAQAYSSIVDILNARGEPTPARLVRAA